MALDVPQAKIRSKNQAAASVHDAGVLPDQEHLSRISAFVTKFDFSQPNNIERILSYTLNYMQGRFALYNRFDLRQKQIITWLGCQLPENFRRRGRLSGRVCFEEFMCQGKSGAEFGDLRTSPYWISDPDIKKHGLLAYIGAPVILAGRVLGSLVVYDSRPREFDPAFGSIMNFMAALLAFIEERSKVELNLRKKMANEKMVADISAEASASLEVETYLDQCLKIIGQALRVDSVAVLLYDDIYQDLRMLSRWHTAELSEAMPGDNLVEVLALRKVADAIRQKKMFQCQDTNKLTARTDRELLSSRKIKSLLVMPLCNPHRMFGVCVLHMQDAVRVWREEDLSTLRTVIRIIVQWIEGRAMADLLDESEALNYQMIQLSPTAIYRIDLVNRRFLKVNEYMCQKSGYTEDELLNMNPEDLLTPRSQALFRERLLSMAVGKDVSGNVEFEIETKSGKIEWGNLHIRHLYSNGRIAGANVVAHIITEQRQAQKELSRYRKELESLVQERTQELSHANDLLRREIERRTQTAIELQQKTEHLKELNTAMRVVLDKRNEDQQRMEEKIRIKLAELIEPYLDRLENYDFGDTQKQLLNLIRMNLDEVAGFRMPTISSEYINFTPGEIQVANLIRKGKMNKEIARLLNLSIRTVESYRNSIRKKLGLKNKKVDLRAYLSSK